MKIRLLIAAVLVSVLSFGQTPIQVIKLTNSSSPFGQSVPQGSILVDMSNNKEYLTLVPLLGTGKISDYLPIYPSLSSAEIKEISNTDHTGDVSGTSGSTNLTIGTDKVLTGMIKDNQVTLSKMAKIPPLHILGNSTSSEAVPEPILISSGLTLSNDGTSSKLTSYGGTLTTINTNTLNGIEASVNYSGSNSSVATIDLALNNLDNTSVTSGIIRGSQLQSTAPQGTAPFTVISTTAVPKLSIGGNAATADVATLASNISGSVKGSIPYQTGADITSLLPPGASGQILRVNTAGNAPQWTNIASIPKPVKTLDNTPATVIWNVDTDGPNAIISLSRNITIKIVISAIGTSGNLTVTNPATWTLILDFSGTIKIHPDIWVGPPYSHLVNTTLNSSTEPNSTPDVFTWYYDGNMLFWSGKNGFKN